MPELREPPPVAGLAARADRERLRQVLTALIANAVKYNRPGGVVLIEARQSDGGVSLDVRDTGPGIAPEFHSAVFEKFKQLENFMTREHGGTGLGLALVKQLVEHMGGQISLESAVGAGATFTIQLPEDTRHV